MVQRHDSESEDKSTRGSDVPITRGKRIWNTLHSHATFHTRQLDPFITTIKNTFHCVQNSSEHPFSEELYFVPVLSLVFWIFRTFLTIFCSSTKKARMILHIVVTHEITR